MSYESYLVPPDRVTVLLGEAGLVVAARLVQEPAEREKRPHACFLARRAEQS